MITRIATAFLVCGLLGATAASAAIVDCAPTAGFTACKRITYSGGDQTFTVPSGITSISIRAWGAAGGGANATWYTIQGGGAAGGFASGTVAVTPGQALTVVVGQGGIPNSTVTTYGGGGAGGNRTGNATAIGGSGGGYSGVFAPGGKTAANARVIAGGGGGASPGSDNGAAGPGGGGGTTGGNDALPIRSGRGGTQIGGGAAATGTSSCSVAQTAGSQFQGGNGGSSSLTQPHEGGGGGGGGYFGGGGGLCQSGSGTQNGGGGGGSSFTAGAGVTAGTTAAGQNFLNTGAACAGNANAGGASDSLYTAGVGQGSCYGVGGNGEVVIQYRIATLRVSKVTVGNAPGAQVFGFTGDNGFGSESLTIPANTAGTTVTGTIRPLANSSTVTTVSEAVPTGYKVTSINCTGIGAGSATYNLALGSAQLNAAATANINDITCAFTNTKLPTVRVSKISNGGTGTFDFSGDNGFGTDSILTLSTGTSTPGATRILADASTSTTLAETVPSNFFVSGISCTGLGGGSATYNVTAGTVLLDTNATAPGNTIECTYTNTQVITSLSLLKTASTAGPVSAGDTITYTFRVTNTGNRPIANVVINETAFNGSGGLPTAANESLFTDNAPVGDSVNGASNDGVWQTLGPGDVATFTANYTVTQADIDNLQ